MPQFLIDPSSIKNSTVSLAGNDAKHISTVLRLKAGDWIMLTDGRGNRFKATITLSSPKKVECSIVSSMPADREKRTTDITLAVAMIRQDRFEWVIQKAVELGCKEIVPFVSERTVPRPGGSRSVRWQKIADEAAKQCGTAIRPRVASPLELNDLFKAYEKVGQKILFYEGETDLKLTALTLERSKTLMMIGPEGGFASREVAMAKDAGALVCSLGPLILRVETAAIAGLVLVQDKLGYFG